VAVFLATTAIGLVYYAAGYPDGPATIGLFVATYTLAAEDDGRRSLRLAAAGIAVLAVGWLLAADPEACNRAGWVLFRIGTAVMAATLDESVRGRACWRPTQWRGGAGRADQGGGAWRRWICSHRWPNGPQLPLRTQFRARGRALPALTPGSTASTAGGT
jgi:hypothetical protein